jgi:molybdate transport system ATP-binding protein
MLQLQDLSVEFDEGFKLNQINWQIEQHQHWLITGANGAGKSALAAVLAGCGEILSGSTSGLPSNIGWVSFEAQAELIQAELKKDDADILDVISLGTPVREIIFTAQINANIANDLIQKFELEYLLERAFRKLSTGETRKVMLIRALACKAELLILDEPFDGLDQASHTMLQNHLAQVATHTPVVMVLNRFDEIPDFISHVAYMEQGQLRYQVERQDTKAYNELYQLLHLKTTDLQVPDKDAADTTKPLNPNEPLVKLSNICIKHEDMVLIDKLNWCIEANQHWQLSGPNGSGKTALLSLITGDHPQCYTNDIFVFGFKRGQGESIWQIKQYIGYVSTALQWEYRVGTSLRNVIISGFYDSIGLYSKSTDQQKRIADEWLALLGMQNRGDQPFNKLSYGDQRLLLIARAMVKHPPLLILDEPCLGLDDINRQLVLALIEKVCAAKETSVVYVNHHAKDRIQGIDNYLALEKSADNT